MLTPRRNSILDDDTPWRTKRSFGDPRLTRHFTWSCQRRLRLFHREETRLAFCERLIEAAGSRAASHTRRWRHGSDTDRRRWRRCLPTASLAGFGWRAAGTTAPCGTPTTVARKPRTWWRTRCAAGWWSDRRDGAHRPRRLGGGSGCCRSGGTGSGGERFWLEMDRHRLKPVAPGQSNTRMFPLLRCHRLQPVLLLPQPNRRVSLCSSKAPGAGSGKRSAVMTWSQTFTKSRTNFAPASSQA